MDDFLCLFLDLSFSSMEKEINPMIFFGLFILFEVILARGMKDR